jgi:hypothetical protein
VLPRLAAPISKLAWTKPMKMHKMPNGKMMEGAKHEKSEGAKERKAEYGSKKVEITYKKKKK